MNASLPKLPGPKTPKGKRTSSRNAIKHGLTAAHPVTAEEGKRLTYLNKELKKEYRPESITEELLIDRLANIQLRLERINLQERAWYDQARREAGDMEKILDDLNLSYEAERGFAFYLNRQDSEDIKHRLASIPFVTHRDVFTEIAEGLATEKPPTSYEEFLMDYPTLHKRICFYCKAFDFRPVIFLMDFEEVPDETVKWLADFPVVDKLFEEDEVDIFEYEMADALKEKSLNFEKLVRMTCEKLQEKLQIESTQRQVLEAMESMPAIAGPPKEHMDQLMRYSTSLNNQFSKALGELRHVVQERKREQLIQSN